MNPLSLALSMLALEEAQASTRTRASVPEADPAPLDAAGRAALSAAWRRWAAEGRASHDPGRLPERRVDQPVRQALPAGAEG